MVNVTSALILSVIIFAVIVLVLIIAGMALVKRGIVPKRTMIRAVISVVVFAILYWCSDLVLGWRGYNIDLRAIKYLAAVIGAGCYWIGSNQR